MSLEDSINALAASNDAIANAITHLASVIRQAPQPVGRVVAREEVDPEVPEGEAQPPAPAPRGPGRPKKAPPPSPMEAASSPQVSAPPPSTAVATTPATSTPASAPAAASGSAPSVATGDGDTPEAQYDTLKSLVPPYCAKFGRAKMMQHFAALGAASGPAFLEPALQGKIPEAIRLLRSEIGAQ